FDQLFTQRQKDRGVACGVLQLRFRQLEVPVAQALRFIDRLVEVSTRNCLQPVAFFDVAGADELARQQRIEQSTKLDSEIVLNELRVEFRVVRNLNRSWRFEDAAQGRQCF